MDGKNPQVDAFIGRSEKWQQAFTALRAVILDSPLTEELKWGKPCYTYDKNNVLILQGFKEFGALLFPKGALLRDPANVLAKPGENTQSARRIEFRNPQETAKIAGLLKSYIDEAIAIEKAGLKVEFKQTADFAIPEEFQSRLDSDPALKAAFFDLTPGRQRGYLLHFSSAKQAKTRASRVEKCVDRILDGQGLND
ncbi:YdeI/OmpD-associated family protein [Microbulbifer sp. SAOS-129_SWC]|uniref:YdeI/OmpD-associated family protein n=1 Tax=Microbulbifer sp. SAOS-129_SWC TaxID=3145235 RepID=UPI00321684E7